MQHGFSLVREEALSEVGGIARLWKHDITGAELLSIVNQDENKSFGVSFRTPPKDSTGVAHILEHSVLCGSQKYPVKEPFVELLKSSLQTFLNALTFPDKTCYPVASTNLQDFYNLIDVYVDAVFYPRIDEDVLRQEGWHIEVDADGEWSYKGVVFNEMKGVYSSPDSVLMEESQHAVFPDMLYSLDSGGDPEKILDLTFEQFREFHAQYYHPSNARFFFWGDDAEDVRLEKMGALLAPFERRDVDSAVPLQPRRDVERKIEALYAADPKETASDVDSEFEDDGDNAPDNESSDNTPQGHVTVSWLLCESSDVEEMMVLEMLDHIISGLPGSPLRKALVDSGLGEDITGAGLETDLRQAYYSIGLRSIQPEDGDAVEVLVMDTLAELAEAGVPAKAIDAALNSLEFDLRENNTGRFPRGLSAMFRSLTTWLYDGDPMAPLAWEKPLASVKARLAAKEAVFENALRRWFLDNNHRITVVLSPDTQLAEQRKQRENARLEAARAAMDEISRAETAAIAERLRLAQEKPDAPEALDTIPSLVLADLPLKNAVLPCEVKTGDLAVTLHDLDTTGILYARMLLPLDAVSDRLLPLVSLYSRALTEMGTARRDFVDLGLELAAKTGNLDAFPTMQTRLDNASTLAALEISGKSTSDKIGKLTGLIHEILLEPKFDNRERFTQMVLEEKARLEQTIIPGGHSLVSVRLGGGLSATGRLIELTGGITYLSFIRDLAKRMENRWPSVLADLHDLHRLIVRRDKALLSLTADASILPDAEKQFRTLANALPVNPSPDAVRGALTPPQAEALLAPAQVNYVGLGMNMHDIGYRFHGAASVVLRHLRMGYLWDRVRVQGGAYGVYANYSRSSGSFVFLSYRDPNVVSTLDIYRQAADYLGNVSLSQQDIVRSIVGAIGDMDAYLLPGAKGNSAMWRYLTGDSDEIRQRIRDEALATTLADFHNFAPYLAKALETATPCVLGGPAADAAAQQYGWVKTRLL